MTVLEQPIEEFPVRDVKVKEISENEPVLNQDDNKSSAFPGWSFRNKEDGPGGYIVCQDNEKSRFLEMPPGTWIISEANEILAGPFPLQSMTTHLTNFITSSNDKETEKSLHQTNTNHPVKCLNSGEGSSHVEDVPRTPEEFQPDFNSTLEISSFEDIHTNVEEKGDLDESVILAGASLFLPTKNDTEIPKPFKLSEMVEALTEVMKKGKGKHAAQECKCFNNPFAEQAKVEEDANTIHKKNMNHNSLPQDVNSNEETTFDRRTVFQPFVKRFLRIFSSELEGSQLGADMKMQLNEMGSNPPARVLFPEALHKS